MYFYHLFLKVANHPFTSFRGGVDTGGKFFGSFDPSGSSGNPILLLTSLTASLTTSVVSILNLLTSPLVGCSLTFLHFSLNFTITSSGIGSPNLIRRYCFVDG